MASSLLSRAAARRPKAKQRFLRGNALAAAVILALALGAIAKPAGASIYGLEWPGDGSVRRMLYWDNPFPIYDATYIFKVHPRLKTDTAHYYTTFFWGNNGAFAWDGGQPNTYYGAHPYPVPAPDGPGQWEISVASNDYVTGSEVEWDRWHTQAFRAWRVSESIVRHEFYWDLPDTTRVIRVTINDPIWARENPPAPAIVMGQAPNLNGSSWGGYVGWEEFSGIIRGIQIYSGLLSVAEIESEIAAPKSTTAGQSHLWYLNLDPRPTDVADKKGIGVPNHPSWDGATALEWVDPTQGSIPTSVEQVPVVVACDGVPLRADGYTSTRPRFLVRIEGVADLDPAAAEISIDGRRQSVTTAASPREAGSRQAGAPALSGALEFVTEELAEGPHELRVRVFDAERIKMGETAIRFFAASRLRIQSPRVFPNPASSVAHLAFTLTRPATVELWVFDVAGRAVYHEGPRAGAAAVNQVRVPRGVEGPGRAEGIYFYVLRATHEGQQAVSKGRIVFLR